MKTCNSLLCLITAVVSITFYSPAFGKDDCGISAETFKRASNEERRGILQRSVRGGDACLPQLETLLALTSKGPHADYEDVLSAIASGGTEKAAALLRDEIYEKRKVDSRLAINALANMGRIGLKHLTTISEKKELAFTKALMPFISPTPEAVKAREAVALITDPAAAGDLAALLNTWVRPFAWKALSVIKAPGYEAQALALWQDRSIWREDRAYALGYLLAVDRPRYLPLLRKELQDFDAEVARLVRGDREPLAVGSRAYPADDREELLIVLLYLGGDAVAVPSLTAFVDSRIWDRQYRGQVRERDIFPAVLALGLSHAPAAAPQLLRLLREDILVDPRIDGLDRLIRDEHPSWPQLRQYERNNRGFPISAAAAVALAELGDRSAIPALQEAAGRNPDIRGVFEGAIAQLRKCAHVKEMCGGIAGIVCCPGLECNYGGTYPDAGGICRK